MLVVVLILRESRLIVLEVVDEEDEVGCVAMGNRYYRTASTLLGAHLSNLATKAKVRVTSSMRHKMVMIMPSNIVRRRRPRGKVRIVRGNKVFGF